VLNRQLLVVRHLPRLELRPHVVAADARGEYHLPVFLGQRQDILGEAEKEGGIGVGLALDDPGLSQFLAMRLQAGELLQFVEVLIGLGLLVAVVFFALRAAAVAQAAAF